MPTCPAGIDHMPTGALVGVDVDFDCVRDFNLVMFGPAFIRRSNPVDDSSNYPGTRPVDGHLDVIDTEMLAMSLTGGGVTLTAGAGMGAIPLAPTRGNVAEQPGNPNLADSFFDVFFEVDLGGENRLYNQTPLVVQSVIDCVPPDRMYAHPTGLCIPLYDHPTPGMGVHRANLVSANHDPFPRPGACCLAGSCQIVTSVECGAAGGTFMGEGSLCTPTLCAPPDPCAGTPCGDSNCDGVVNILDINFFIAAVNGQAAWNAAHGGNPSCDYCCANDTNCDGVVNILDINGFVSAVNAGGCPTSPNCQ
ncbi:hypothetical protein RAS1_00390 [Phycisphaerae bacterium RAS1]|nr:hypothetical protein RAS1_00390 [Phycisphaerae bacterium RAS1]